MGGILGALLRGMRARALLSIGSVVLMALAVGSAVLGPIFAESVTNSFAITKLREAPATLTGQSRVFTPQRLDVETAPGQALAAVATIDHGPWGRSSTTVQSQDFSALRGIVTFWSRPDACEVLQIEGECPSGPGEVLMLARDAELFDATIGQDVVLPIFEPHSSLAALPRPPMRTVRLVGTYTTPTTSQDWLDPNLLTSTPERASESGNYVPARLGPLITVPQTFTSIPKWTVRVDTPIRVDADLTADDLDAAIADVDTLGKKRRVAGGVLSRVGTTDLRMVASEVAQQESTARASIAPAVLSLVLVALALLMRLLNAASEIRVPELALASLRGLTARRLWALGLAEPIILLLIASPVGLALGLGLTLALNRAWLIPGLPMPLVTASWVGAALVVLAAIAVACVAVGRVVRESLASHLAGVRRPAASRTWSLLAQLTLVAVAVAVLISKLAAGSTGNPDAIDLVLPVLLAVVAGLAATRLVAWLAGWWTRRSSGRSLSAFVSARAISRRQEGTLVILPITAAIAVAVFGAGVYDSAANWRASVAATVSPADSTWHSPLPLAETTRLTHELDPDGRWLLAAGTVTNPGAGVAIVDTARLASVASWPPSWSPGASVASVADRIRPHGDVPVLRGRRLTMRVDNQVETERGLSVELRFGSHGGKPEREYLGPFDQGEHLIRAKLPEFCAQGCPLEGLTFGGGAGSTIAMAGVITVADVQVDGQPVSGALEGAGWEPTPDPAVKSSVTSVGVQDGRLVIETDSEGSVGMARLSAGGVEQLRPVLLGVDVDPKGPAMERLQSSSGLVPVRPVGEVEGMPFFGPAGVLIDTSSFVTDRPVFDTAIDVRVLLSADAPASVREQLSERGFSLDTTLAQQKKVLGQSAYALALRLYAVVAALVLLMAMAGLVVSTAVQLPARRRDAAALRVVGVAKPQVMTAVMWEFMAVLGAAAIAGILAGSLAQYVVLKTITLGYVEGLATPALVASISPVRLVVLALVASAVFGLAAGVSALLTVRGARGATLRESAR